MTNRLVAVALTLGALSGTAVRADNFHMGQDIDRHVTLRAYSADGACNGDLEFFRVNTLGQAENEPFVVPAEYRLVITDVQWSAFKTGSGDDLYEGRPATLRLSAGNGSTYIFQAASVVVDASKFVSTSEHLTSGAVVGEKLSVCPSASQQENPSWGWSVQIHTAMLHGYLVKSSPR